MGVRLAISVREFRRKGEAEERRKEKRLCGFKNSVSKTDGKVVPSKSFDSVNPRFVPVVKADEITSLSLKRQRSVVNRCSVSSWCCCVETLPRAGRQGLNSALCPSVPVSRTRQQRSDTGWGYCQ